MGLAKGTYVHSVCATCGTPTYQSTLVPMPELCVDCWYAEEFEFLGQHGFLKEHEETEDLPDGD